MSDDLDLTPTGQARSKRILADAVALGQTMARRRRAARLATLAALPLVLLTAITLRTLAPHRTTPSEPGPIAGQTPPAPVGVEPPIGRVVLLRQDPSVVSRYAIRSDGFQHVQRIGDDELLHALGAAGVHGGLATIGDATHLVLR